MQKKESGAGEKKRGKGTAAKCGPVYWRCEPRVSEQARGFSWSYGTQGPLSQREGPTPPNSWVVFGSEIPGGGAEGQST
jgi:hypothetical protein